MRAMILQKIKSPLVLEEIPEPIPQKGEVLIKVDACGVCRTDLHVYDGELAHPKLPLILGHQIVGKIAQLGEGAQRFKLGQRVGVPWLGHTCQKCQYCLSGRENLCDNALFTGYQLNGGYAEYCVADEHYAFLLPTSYSDTQVAPLLCAGLIGYRAYRMAGNVNSLGFYGFGSSAHLLAQVAVYEKKKVYAFTRPGDMKTQAFARSLGAVWAGGADEPPPAPLDAAIIFASAGELIPAALRTLKKGGVVVCAGIHMSDIPSFPYSILWEERKVCSVANLTRQDGVDFFELASKVSLHTQVTEYRIEDANQALDDLRSGKVQGSLVLKTRLAP